MLQKGLFALALMGTINCYGAVTISTPTTNVLSEKKQEIESLTEQKEYFKACAALANFLQSNLETSLRPATLQFAIDKAVRFAYLNNELINQNIESDLGIGLEHLAQEIITSLSEHSPQTVIPFATEMLELTPKHSPANSGLLIEDLFYHFGPHMTWLDFIALVNTYLTLNFDTAFLQTLSIRYRTVNNLLSTQHSQPNVIEAAQNYDYDLGNVMLGKDYVEHFFAEEKTIREKYDIVRANAEIELCKIGQ